MGRGVESNREEDWMDGIGRGTERNRGKEWKRKK